MSRLYEFMKMSTDDKDIAKLRSVSFRLVREDTEHRQLLYSIDEGVAKDILDLYVELNTELKKRYNGLYKFDLCIDEGVGINVLKIKRKQAKSLSLFCHQINDKLSKIKRNIEESMSTKDDK
jgi:hypothetical protein